jgi:glucokinase
MLLAGDVGGTHTRLGLFTPDGPRPLPRDVRTYSTGAFATIDAMLSAFLADAGAPPGTVTAAAFGVAGPVVHGRASLTNVSWQVEAAAVARALGLADVRLLNDLTAMACAIPVLTAAEWHTLQAGTANPDGNIALIAPGTGLGEAHLIRANDEWVPSPSEGGHADFAARTPREVELLAFLTRQFGRVDYERVISGPGLVHIHGFAHRSPCGFVDPQAPDAAARISASALERRCDACIESLDIFVGVLGAEAGNTALRTVATGGVYLGGGIPPKILPALDTPLFLEAFLAKAPMQELLAQIPVHVIVHPDPGLLGAAVVAARRI